jgi:hypothetical protein
VKALCRTLFTAAAHTPDLLIALAEEVPPAVFSEDLQVSVPLCRVVRSDALAYAPTEAEEAVGGVAHVFWVGSPPEAGAPARTLLESLVARQALLEPFDRAAAGLREAYAES